MSKTVRWVVVVVALIAPSVARAENFYGAVRGGPGVTTDTRANTGLGNPGAEELIEFKTGFTAGVGVASMSSIIRLVDSR